MTFQTTTDKLDGEVLSGLRTAAYSDVADRISYVITSKSLPWIDGYGDAQAHDQHIFHGACAICKAGYAPLALRVVIDAVLEALGELDGK